MLNTHISHLLFVLRHLGKTTLSGFTLLHHEKQHYIAKTTNNKSCNEVQDIQSFTNYNFKTVFYLYFDKIKKF